MTLNKATRDVEGEMGDVCMREAVSLPIQSGVCTFSRTERTFVPHVLQKMWGQEQHWRTEGWSKKGLVSSASSVILLVHRTYAHIGERQSKSCIFLYY